jgi:hypothetical protein
MTKILTGRSNSPLKQHHQHIAASHCKLAPDISRRRVFCRYLDNFADACSIATVGHALYGATLIQFNFRAVHARGKLIAEFGESTRVYCHVSLM